MKYVLSYDIGTTGVKTCLFGIDKTIDLVCHASRDYNLYTFPDGGAEQHEDEWWQGMCESTEEVFTKTSITPEMVEGISFCSQMQGVVLVDKDGVPVHHPLSYMDQRAKKEIKEGIAYGIQVAGANIFKLIPSLIITGAVTSSVKDPVWKYKWIEKHEPENFARAYRWLDVKDYLISRCTGRFTMTQDSAFATLIYDTRKGLEGWSKKMCSMFDIKEDLLPEIIKSTDCVGGLTDKAAAELHLVPGTKVYGGGGDSSLIGVGAGCVNVGDTHIYSGTSGWVITVTDKQMVDTSAMIAAITGAQDGKYNYFAEMETAGKSIHWLKEMLGIETYEEYVKLVESSPVGSNGLIYAPWLHGNRCPFEDPNSTALFIGVKLETTKADMARAAVEGVAYHLRWMLECQDKKLKTSDVIRYVGGSSQSPLFCQILADIIGRPVETVASPSNVGAVGAAAITAVGIGAVDKIEDVAGLIPANAKYEPNQQAHQLYEKPYQTFKRLYKSNKNVFALLGGK